MWAGAGGVTMARQGPILGHQISLAGPSQPEICKDVHGSCNALFEWSGALAHA